MTRPRRCRRVSAEPACRVFKPSGIPSRQLEEVILAVEEFEALRLADMEGLYQEAAAEFMGVSRATFGRVLQVARAKVARALTLGLALAIEGGSYMKTEEKHVCCGGRGRKRHEAGAAGGTCGCGGKGKGHAEGGECRSEGHGGQGGCCRDESKPGGD